MVDGPCSRCDQPAVVAVNGSPACLRHFDDLLADAMSMVEQLAALTDEQWENPAQR